MGQVSEEQLERREKFGTEFCVMVKGLCLLEREEQETDGEAFSFWV